MRIAFLSTIYPYRGGIAQFNTYLYRALQAEHQVSLYTWTRQYPGILFPGKTQFVEDSKTDNDIHSIRVLDSINPISWYRTARIIAAQKPDLVIMRYWMSFFAPSLGCVAAYLKKRGIKVVTIVDNAIPHEPHIYDKVLARWFFRRNTALVALCDSVFKELEFLCADTPRRLLFHPLYDHYGQSVDRTQACRSLGLDPEKKTLLFFGFIRQYKGLDLLMKAMDMLGDDYQLLAAGECYGSFEPYELLLNELQSRDRIKILNRYISDTEVAMIFSAADVCVLPYRSATQSGIMAMAYHFELPVLATPVGDLARAVDSEGTGLVIPYPEAGPIAVTVKEYFSRSKEPFVQNIKEAKKSLSWQVFTRELMDFVKSPAFCQN